MDLTYFNYTNHTAESWFERRSFLRQWWRLQASDRRWTPPSYPRLYRLLVKQDSAYLTSLFPILFRMEALPRRQRRDSEPGSLNFSGALMEETVAATVLYTDAQRAPAVGYLGFLHCVNHVATFERFWGELLEPLWSLGCRRVLGPAGLAPGLPMGALQNYFHVTPPMHTPYNPPYLPELLESVLEPVWENQLYHYPLPPILPTAPPVAEIAPFDPIRLANDLLPLFTAAVTPEDETASLTPGEVQFLLDWLWAPTGHALLATLGGQPVGFLLLQPDVTSVLRQAGGGRNLVRRVWLAWRSQQPVGSGRLLYGAVLPAWRGRGIGAQLWVTALALARQQGWHSLTIGPLRSGSPAARFLHCQGAEPRQRYVVYGADL